MNPRKQNPLAADSTLRVSMNNSKVYCHETGKCVKKCVAKDTTKKHKCHPRKVCWPS